MKFEIGDKTDSALCKTLVHEMYLCKDAFDKFVKLAYSNIMGLRDKATKIKTHDAYSSFLHHLYEFYVGCYQRDSRNTHKINNELLDRMLTGEVRKLLRNKINAIQGGYAPSWENDISYYQVEVPDNFGETFRHIRNRTAHSLIRRVVPGEHTTLLDFFKDNHKFIYQLFYSGQQFWEIGDIEKIEWGAIEDFDLYVEQNKTDDPLTFNINTEY